MKKESSISGAGKWKGAGDGAVPRGRSCVPCPAELCTDGPLTVLQLFSNCPLSVLLIPWFQVRVFQAQLSCEVADTFLPEWQSCLKAKNVGCHFQSRSRLSKEKPRLKQLGESASPLSFETLSVNQLKLEFLVKLPDAKELPEDAGPPQEGLDLV